MPISASRAAAFDVLLRIERTDAYASELLHSSAFAKLSPADHALLTELVMGVLRWRSALDGLITVRSSAALSKFDVEVLAALRLGAYQLLFLDRIPGRAAINESVELTKRARKRSASGLVNAVLRKIAEVASRTKLTALSAHPQWMVDSWSATYGANVAQMICEYDQQQPAPVLRISHAAILKELADAEVCLDPTGFLANAYRVISGDITATKLFRERQINIQDEGSHLVALLAGHGKSILDCCAAPGGKTRIVAEQNPNAQIVALEIHPHRAVLMRKLVSNPNVSLVAADASAIPLRKQFDRVLVDVPCSGTGTLARNPEIKWRLKPEDLPRLQSYQLEILTSAMRHVASGGRIIYSTCSLEPEENEHVVEQALQGHSCFALVDCRNELERLQASGELCASNSLLSGPYLRTIPGRHVCDGFFAAILEKKN